MARKLKVGDDPAGMHGARLDGLAAVATTPRWRFRLRRRLYREAYVESALARWDSIFDTVEEGL